MHPQAQQGVIRGREVRSSVAIVQREQHGVEHARAEAAQVVGGGVALTLEAVEHPGVEAHRVAQDRRRIAHPGRRLS